MGALAALIATLAAIVWAGLAPLEFEPDNEVEWLDPGPGLHFERGGIAYSETSVDWQLRGWPAEVSVELWVVPGDEPEVRMGQIFAVFDGDRIDPLLIAQWKSGLVVRNRVVGENGRVHYRELGALGLLFRGQSRYIAVTSGEAGTSVFLDGRATADRSNIPVIAARERFGGRFVFGNAANGTAPWQGDLLGAAVYRRLLSPEEIVDHHGRVSAAGVSSLADEPGLVALYPFDERSGESAHSRAATGPHLSVPLAFRRLRTQTLQLPTLRGRRPDSFGLDALLNIAGFMPLGFFSLIAIRRRRWAAGRSAFVGAVLLGTAMSLGIELVQVELPARVSSATDLACNLLGTVFGAGLGFRGPIAARLFADG